jgi:putative transposase
MTAFIDEHRGRFGVEPICKSLQFAPSTYYQAKKREVEPADRARRDAWLSGQIRRVHVENLKVYGPGRCGGSWPGRASRCRAAR